ncbi:Protein of unknown function DUF952 [Rhabdaerophilaceae bacterium]
MAQVFKIMGHEEWAGFQGTGSFTGSVVDHKDGFIHLSHSHQVAETARRHFAGQAGLMLVALSAEALGSALRDEPSRGGDLFPHAYEPLAMTAVLWAKPMPLWPDGVPLCPNLEDE